MIIFETGTIRITTPMQYATQVPTRYLYRSHAYITGAIYRKSPPFYGRNIFILKRILKNLSLSHGSPRICSGFCLCICMLPVFGVSFMVPSCSLTLALLGFPPVPLKLQVDSGSLGGGPAFQPHVRAQVGPGNLNGPQRPHRACGLASGPSTSGPRPGRP